MAILTPEYLTGPQYPAIRDRRVIEHGGAVQRGVWDERDCKVSITAPISMNIKVEPGYALVPANQTGNLGFYGVEISAEETIAMPANSSGQPRVDAVILRVNDPSGDLAATSANATLEVIQGTPTAGATLFNRTGAVATSAFPKASLHLGDVLVPASGSIGDVRSRRTFARGACWTERLSNLGTLTYAATANPYHLMAFELDCSLELTGVPVELSMSLGAYTSTAGIVSAQFGWVARENYTANSEIFITGNGHGQTVTTAVRHQQSQRVTTNALTAGCWTFNTIVKPITASANVIVCFDTLSPATVLVREIVTDTLASAHNGGGI